MIWPKFRSSIFDRTWSASASNLRESHDTAVILILSTGNVNIPLATDRFGLNTVMRNLHVSDLFPNLSVARYTLSIYFRIVS